MTRNDALRLLTLAVSLLPLSAPLAHAQVINVPSGPTPSPHTIDVDTPASNTNIGVDALGELFIQNTSVVTATGTVTVGGIGNGTLEISDGSVLTSPTGIIANGAGSMGSVTLDDASIWANSGTLTVGNSGAATLTILGNSEVTSGLSRIGFNAGSIGIVTVDGGSTWTTSGTLTVGNSGAGTLAGRVKVVVA